MTNADIMAGISGTAAILAVASFVVSTNHNYFPETRQACAVIAVVLAVVALWAGLVAVSL